MSGVRCQVSVTRWRGTYDSDLRFRFSSFLRHLTFDIRHCGGRCQVSVDSGKLEAGSWELEDREGEGDSCQLLATRWRGRPSA